MSLILGSRVGPYEVRGPLGAGGMGVVVRARDTQLQREVALKLLPEHLANDSDRIALFQREARVLASLNHPNVAQIYGLEQASGMSCIVMELVEGETLADRIKRGPVPLPEALRIARQIADGLEAAHERGIVHRDLKPRNIKLTPDGTVKILDFGLAKAVSSDAVDGKPSDSATRVTASPTAGVVMGTPGYMSPEQARGHDVDKRTDIWAFGCVLYEMVTGSRLFEGQNPTDTLGAILHKEPVWNKVPPSVVPLLRRCLEKDVKHRLRDIGDAMAWVDVAPAAATATRQSRQWLAWGVAALFIATSMGLAFVHFRSTAAPVDTTRYQIPAPDKTTFADYVKVSPNGRRIAFTARGADSQVRIWVRDLATLESRQLEGTERVGSLIWSPDSRFLAFGVGGELKRVDASGGPTQTLAKSQTTVGSGSWSKDDVIVFGGRGSGPLQQVLATGGDPSPVTALSKERGETFHTFPSFLPDGRHFTYFVGSSIADNIGTFIGSLDVKPEEQNRNRLAASPFGASFVAGDDPVVGHLLFLRDRTLMAQVLDTRHLTLTGEPVPVAEQVATVNQSAVFSASNTGVLAYRSGLGATLANITWVDRNGREPADPIATKLAAAENPRLSPDGHKLVARAGIDLWVFDLDGKPPIKLTPGDGPRSPVWTPDGRRIIYEANEQSAGTNILMSIPADGSGTRQQAATNLHFHPYGFLPNGDVLAAQLVAGVDQVDIVRVPLNPKSPPVAIVATPAQEGLNGAAVSPDGQWLAYASDATGNSEIWARSLSGAGGPKRVSPDGGFEPMWSRDGRELFYINGLRMMSVAVDTRSEFNFKPATPLFESRIVRSQQPPSYDVAADGRFVIIRSADTAPNPITVVTNWTASLARK